MRKIFSNFGLNFVLLTKKLIVGRRIFVLLLLWMYADSLIGQDVTVFNENGKWIIQGVRVYAIDFPDTLKTNEQGMVNIDIFPSETKIVFSFPYFTTVSYTKDELANLNYMIYMESSLYNQFTNLGYFTTREYAYDLPFYIELINPDEVFSAESKTFNSNEEGRSYIQALESKRILFSIDGIRINDELYRNGVIHKLLTYNSSIFSDVRKLNSPGFLSFSPDAIGGVYVYFIKTPMFSIKKNFQVNTMSSFYSSNLSFVSSVNLLYSQKNLSSLTLLSFGHFGDIVMGKNRKNLSLEDSVYGLKDFFVVHNNTDSIYINTNPYKQIGTKYNQFYLMQKLAIKLSKKDKIFARFHYIGNSQMNMYSATSEKIGEIPRYAEAYFMPQDRFIINLNYYFEGSKILYDILSLGFTDIYYNEYRYTRRFNSDWGLHQKEQINSIKVNLDFAKKVGEGPLVYGFSYSSCNVNSSAFMKNIKTNDFKQGLNRYPNEQSNSQILGLYFNYKYLGNAYYNYSFAFRLDYKNMYAQFSNLLIPIDFLEINKKNMFAPAFSAHIETLLFTKLNIGALFTAATQLPTLDQMTKTMFKDFVITVPTNDLKPEKDLSLKLMFNLNLQDELIKLYSHSICTYMNNLIMLKKVYMNGVDTFNLAGYVYNVASLGNNKSAYMIGNSSGIYYKQKLWSEDAFLVTNFNVSISKGFNLSDSLPVPFIYPMFGFVDLKLLTNDFEFNINYSFNGLKQYNTLSLLGEDYIEKATTKGFLSWQVLNLSFNYNINKSLSMSLDVENVFDRFYIRYGTDYVQSGRNFIFTIKFSL